jgi:hypothetical protein
MERSVSRVMKEGKGEIDELRLDGNLSRDFLALHVLSDNTIPTGVADGQNEAKRNQVQQNKNKTIDLHRLGRDLGGDFLAFIDLDLAIPVESLG